MTEMSLNKITMQILTFKEYPRLKRLSFDQILVEIKPRIDFQVRKHSGKISGFDDDDLRQELIIELWNKLDRLPKDIEYLDYRFTRYIETIFNRRIIDLHRSQLISRKPGEYRDGLMRATFVENIEEVIEG